MHYRELFENKIEIPRCWISPDGEIVEWEGSHSEMVCDDPVKYGLDPTRLAALRDWWEENDEYGFDYVIAQAEANGWVRVSGDTALYALTKTGFTPLTMEVDEHETKAFLGAGSLAAKWA